MRSKTIIILIVFSIAMAALESAVVVYLRALFYPEGFSVILKILDQKILLVEIAREFATIVMLWAVGYMAGRTFRERLAFFLLSFAVWDIFYYVWLWVFIGWPSSLMEWDILFLIPITWLGPVLAPIICSVTMIGMSAILLVAPKAQKISNLTHLLITLGCTAILYTFMKDYGMLMLKQGFIIDEQFITIAKSQIPQPYSWGIFIFGDLLIISGLLIFTLKAKNINQFVN